jgi:chemotaxis protein histidine kinase CheA
MAEIATADETLIVPIQKGFITHVSPAVDARTLLCGTCKIPMKDKNTRNCNCSEGSLLLKDLSARELSLVASPAYENTVARVYSFSAAVDNEIKRNILNTGDKMVTEDRITRLEASVSALINAFKAAAEEQEEEKKEEMKAEEEAKYAEEEEMKAEEEAKMVPVSKVAEEEGADKEEEEEEMKAEEAEKKIEKLEASIKQLTKLMKASKITPETPEDEPADTVHKIPKISNEPVKSEKLKDGFKLPLITGGMKPGKLHATAGRKAGQSQSFTGANIPAKGDNEQQAVDEIFGFAASRGTVPMKADSRIRTIQYK